MSCTARWRKPPRAQQATTCSNRAPARLDGVVRGAEKARLNRSRSLAGRSDRPRQQSSQVTGGPMVRIHLPPAESRTNSEASEEAVEGACQRSTDAYGALIAARPSAPGANVAHVDEALGGKVHGAPGTKAPNPGTPSGG